MVLVEVREDTSVGLKEGRSSHELSNKLEKYTRRLYWAGVQFHASRALRREDCHTLASASAVQLIGMMTDGGLKVLR